MCTLREVRKTPLSKTNKKNQSFSKPKIIQRDTSHSDIKKRPTLSLSPSFSPPPLSSSFPSPSSLYYLLCRYPLSFVALLSPPSFSPPPLPFFLHRSTTSSRPLRRHSHPIVCLFCHAHPFFFSFVYLLSTVLPLRFFQFVFILIKAIRVI